MRWQKIIINRNKKWWLCITKSILVSFIQWLSVSLDFMLITRTLSRIKVILYFFDITFLKFCEINCYQNKELYLILCLYSDYSTYTGEHFFTKINMRRMGISAFVLLSRFMLSHSLHVILHTLLNIIQLF